MNTPTKQTVYIPVKVEDELPPVSTIDKVFFHSLKNGRIRQAIHYRNGELLECSNINNDDISVSHWLKEQDAFVFTSEQLNEYTANVIKQALFSASEFAELQYECGKKSKEKCLSVFCNNCTEQIDRQSITNTFEETFKKFEI